MMHEHFRACLEEFDMPLARRIWREAMPHLPLPANDTEATIVMHLARTQASSISFRARAWSHAWLTERGLPSGLPDELRPRAQRIYPVVQPTVGIAVQNRTDVALAIRRAMEEAVLDVGVKDSAQTKRAILAARDKARSKLLGIKR